ARDVASIVRWTCNARGVLPGLLTAERDLGQAMRWSVGRTNTRITGCAAIHPGLQTKGRSGSAFAPLSAAQSVELASRLLRGTRAEVSSERAGEPPLVH